jgi:hypothetical protein
MALRGSAQQNRELRRRIPAALAADVCRWTLEPWTSRVPTTMTCHSQVGHMSRQIAAGSTVVATPAARDRTVNLPRPRLLPGCVAAHTGGLGWGAGGLSRSLSMPACVARRCRLRQPVGRVCGMPGHVGGMCTGVRGDVGLRMPLVRLAFNPKHRSRLGGLRKYGQRSLRRVHWTRDCHPNAVPNGLRCPACSSHP